MKKQALLSVVSVSFPLYMGEYPAPLPKQKTGSMAKELQQNPAQYDQVIFLQFLSHFAAWSLDYRGRTLPAVIKLCILYMV